MHKFKIREFCPVEVGTEDYDEWGNIVVRQLYLIEGNKTFEQLLRVVLEIFLRKWSKRYKLILIRCRWLCEGNLHLVFVLASANRIIAYFKVFLQEI